MLGRGGSFACEFGLQFLEFACFFGFPDHHQFGFAELAGEREPQVAQKPRCAAGDARYQRRESLRNSLKSASRALVAAR